MTTVTVTFWTTQSEETRAVRAIHVRLKAMWLMGAAFLVVSGLIGWDAFLNVPYPMVSDQWVGGAFLVLIALFVYICVCLLPSAAIQRARRGQLTVDGPITMAFTETGFAVRSPYSSFEIAWPAVPRVLETREFLLIFASSVSAQRLPKRVLSPEELTEVRHLLQRRLGKRASVWQREAT